MNLILTSDFPATASDVVAARIRSAAPEPRCAWIPDRTDATGSAFRHAREQFASYGLQQLELVDIEDDRDDVQIAYLHEFDVIYLIGSDALRLRYNALRAGLSGRLRQCAARGRLIVAAGAASMLLTPNVSISKLLHEPLAEVMAARPRLEALGAVNYEIIPPRAASGRVCRRIAARLLSTDRQ
jgi:peptidase E